MLSLVKKIFASDVPKNQQQNVVQPIVQEKVVKKDFSQLISFGSTESRNKRLDKVIANLDGCSSDDLNYLVAELLKAMGYSAKIFDGINDRGIDVVGFESGKMTIAVQCKAWNPKRNTVRVGVKDVQAFKGQFIAEYEQGLFITTHYFTEPALAEESDNYYLIDRKKLISLIARYFPKQLSQAFYRETLAELPECQKCNSGKMLKLFSQKGSYYHWCESCEENSYM